MRIVFSRFVAAAFLAVASNSVMAQVTSSPVDALAETLAADPSARQKSARLMEDFLLKPDASNRSFVRDDADRAALSEVARAWAQRADARQLATLQFAAAPGGAAEPRLRAALARWTADAQIGGANEAVAAPAFFADAAERAGMILNDPGFRSEIERSIEANDAVAPPVPGSREALARAQELRRAVPRNAGVFGPDREAEALLASSPLRTPPSAPVPGAPLRPNAPFTSPALLPPSSAIATADAPAAPPAATGAIPPAANLPRNFRNRAVAPAIPSPVPETESAALRASSVLAGATAIEAATNTQIDGKPGEAGEAKLREIFDVTVARLVREGKRRAGTGSVSGIINNVGAYYGPGVNYIRCYDQAEELLTDLNNQVPPKSGWTFRQSTYTGEGHEANGHYWVTAVSSDPRQPSLIMDPWAGEIRTDPSKNPIVIKPFFPWAAGAAGNAVGNAIDWFRSK